MPPPLSPAPAAPLPTQLPALVTKVGADHLVYGSDFCFTPAPVVSAQVAALAEWRDQLAAGTRALFDISGRERP